MESFEFLGGRYNRPEQIMSGPVQAFRAQNAASGRTVFIHRVSTTESPEEQAALLKLLTTALVKSADAKRLVLDFGEESGYWYVVTESDPQCALLREWLQLEIDAAMPGSKLNQATLPPTVLKPVMPAEKVDPGEFTRFIQQRPATTSPTTSTRTSGAPTTPVPPAPTQPNSPMAPGEFSRLFQSRPIQSQPDPPPVNIPAAPATPPAHTGPGEFTRFFNQGEGGLVSGKAAQPPAPPPAQPAAQTTPQDPGEFTRMLGLPPLNLQSPSQVPSVPPPTPPSGEFDSFFSSGQGGLISGKPAQPPAPPPVQPAAQTSPKDPGEFTRLFSTGDGLGGVKTPQTSPLPPTRPDNPIARPPVQPVAEAPQKDPGEFTRFFTPGLPVPPPKPTQNPNPHVQRPNSPFPSLPSQPQSKPVTEPGEFTRMFARPAGASAPASPPPVRSDPMGFAAPPSNQASDFTDNLFNDKINLGAPQPPAQQKQSEFTSIFGAVGSEAPPIAPPSVVAQPREKSPLEDPADSKFKATQELPVARPAAPQNSDPPSTATTGSPSEFTMIMQGGYTPKPVAPAATPAVGAGSAPGKSPISISVPPVKPPALPNLGAASASVPGAHASVSQHGASAGATAPKPPAIPGMANVKLSAPAKPAVNKTLIIFLAVLGVLAIVLVIVVMIMMKGK